MKVHFAADLGDTVVGSGGREVKEYGGERWIGVGGRGGRRAQEGKCEVSPVYRASTVQTKHPFWGMWYLFWV